MAWTGAELGFIFAAVVARPNEVAHGPMLPLSATSAGIWLRSLQGVDRRCFNNWKSLHEEELMLLLDDHWDALIAVSTFMQEMPCQHS